MAYDSQTSRISSILVAATRGPGRAGRAPCPSMGMAAPPHAARTAAIADPDCGHITEGIARGADPESERRANCHK
eukprot:2426164-Prymnesium_polylepis.2